MREKINLKDEITEIIYESIAKEGKLDDIATEIISTIIESLPEEEKNLRITEGFEGQIDPNNETAYNQGWNTYRSEVINLLRGTK